jgi:hypothetical protein
MHLFMLPIGDWADDGHGKHRDFLVESSLPFEFVEEAYGQIEEKTNINLESFCCDFEDGKIPEHIWERLWELGFTTENEEYPHVNVWEFADIVLFLLNYVNPDLNLKTVDVPELHANVGYGLF